MIREVITNKIEELKKDPSSPVYRVIAGLLVSLIFSSYPIFIFLIYMWKNGFYSYDVIGEGFSLSIFFYANLILLIVVSLFMLGSVTTTALSWKLELKKSNDRRRALASSLISNAAFITLNIIVIGVVLWAMWKAEEKDIYVFLLCVSSILIILVTSLAAGTARFYFKVVVLVTGIMYTIPLLNPDKASILLADGLRFFGAGNRGVSLVSTDNQSPFEMKGELVFLSPKYVYLKKSETDNLMIVPRKDSLNIIYVEENKSNRQRNTGSGADAPSPDR